jgi:hypothetical protein
MNDFNDYLLEQIRAKDRVIAELRYELAVLRAEAGDLSELVLIPCGEQIQ